jgi:hypothetical protein
VVAGREPENWSRSSFDGTADPRNVLARLF